MTINLLFISFNVTAFEDQPQIYITELITPQMAQSLYHRVEDARLEDGFIHFRIESDYGSFDVSSLAMLRKRVMEISILGQALSQSRARNNDSAEYTGGEYRISADSAIDIISRPISSATNVAGQVRDNLEETLQGASPGVAARYDSNVDESEEPVMAMHRRNIASQWGLDVFSRNQMVQSFLNNAARKRQAGKIASGAPVLNRRINMPLKVENRILEAEIAALLKNKLSKELRDNNRQLLSGMNISQEIQDDFFQHQIFTPGERTRIIHYLNQLGVVRNRSAFIGYANSVETPAEVMSIEKVAMMLAYYHEHIETLQQLHEGNNVLQAITASNQIVYFVCGDLIHWSRETATYYENLLKHIGMAGYKKWEIVSSADLTEETTAQLTRRGFTIRERFIY